MQVWEGGCPVQNLGCYLLWLLLEGEMSGRKAGLQDVSCLSLEKGSGPLSQQSGAVFGVFSKDHPQCWKWLRWILMGLP